MKYTSHRWRSLLGLVAVLLGGCQQVTAKPQLAPMLAPNFLVVAGGGAPSYNEAGIEEDVLNFQQALSARGFNPGAASILFANGNDGAATVKYVDAKGKEHFKPTKIPNLIGAATLDNLEEWFDLTNLINPNRPVFVYLTGHGDLNQANSDNSHLILWQEKQLSVQGFTGLLDQLPQQTPVVLVGVQCYSGSFANFIYKEGNPQQSLSDQERCGFFAATQKLLSFSCPSPSNDCEDYSSSFFKAVRHHKEQGSKFMTGDTNQDNRVTFAEAHAYAKKMDLTANVPVSTSEAWLQKQISDRDKKAFLQRSISDLAPLARSEQFSVVIALTGLLEFNMGRSFSDNVKQLKPKQIKTSAQKALVKRLSLELINIAAEQQIRDSQNQGKIAILDRLLECESGSLGQQR